jgi:hypothetical protein
MSRTPLAELLPRVATIDTSDQPYWYEVDGEDILGRWDIEAEESDDAGSAAFSMKYTLTIRLDDATGIYTASGNSVEKGSSTGDGDRDMVGYNFSTGKIAKPLHAFLLENGWARKKGFFANLFAR